MTKLAVVLYSYGGRRDRQRTLARLCYDTLSRLPNVAVWLTVDPGEQESPASCYQPIALDAPAGYEYLPDKTIALLRWFASQNQFEYLLKCDDDVILDPWAIARLAGEEALPAYQGVDVKSLPTGTTAMSWHRGKCKTPRLNDHDTNASWAPPDFSFALGTCYMLSRHAVCEALAEFDATAFSLDEARQQLDCRAVGCEDMFVADLLRRRGILPAHSLRVMYVNNVPQILNHYRYELYSRWIRRPGHKRCIGICTPNRSPTSIEQTLISTWPPLSRLIPGR